MVRKFLFAVCILLFSVQVEAQVTIGLDEEPVKGAILQLKTLKVTGGNANSIRGLMLPRVALDVAGSTSGTVGEKLRKSLRLPASETTDASSHIGLIVYNTQSINKATGSPFAENKICPGVYVWTGTLWVRTMTSECQ